jgi:hypothetical protein
MRNKTFFSSVVLSVACVSVANAAVVYDTIDPFTDAASDSSATAPNGVTSTLTGSIYESRFMRTRTSSSASSSSITIGSGSMVFGVTRVGAASTSSGVNQTAEFDYFPDYTNGLYPNFTNFTSITFNFASNFDGILKCKISFFDAVNGPVEKTMTGASGSMTFSLADFGGFGENTAAMDAMNITFTRSGSNASGSLTITNLVANGASIPAPGAIALLGAAGLVGSRRRR